MKLLFPQLPLRRIIHLILFLVLPLCLFSQTYNGSLSISNQVQVDTFHYNIITGNLYINAANIDQLDGLIVLGEVRGNLTIENVDNNPGNGGTLENINGLKNLERVGGNLTLNGTLQAVYVKEGFEKLNYVSGDLILGGDLASPSFRAEIPVFHSLEAVGGDIRMDDLTISGGLNFPRLKRIGRDLRMNYTKMDSTVLSGFDSLTYIGGDFYWYFNFIGPAKHLSAFSQLDTVQHSLWIELVNMEDFDGFSNLKYVGELDIWDTPSNYLLDFSGFNQLEKVGGDLDIYRINDLQNIQFESLKSIGGHLVLNELGIRNQTGRLEAFVNLEKISGRGQNQGLLIFDNYKDTLSGFYKLEEVAWTFSLDNTNYSKIEGFYSLSKIGNQLIFGDNDDLQDLDFLSSLTQVNNGIKFRNNPSLTSCCGLYPYLLTGGNSQDEFSNNGNGCTRLDILNGGLCPGVGGVEAKLISDENGNCFSDSTESGLALWTFDFNQGEKQAITNSDGEIAFIRNYVKDTVQVRVFPPHFINNSNINYCDTLREVYIDSSTFSLKDWNIAVDQCSFLICRLVDSGTLGVFQGVLPLIINIIVQARLQQESCLSGFLPMSSLTQQVRLIAMSGGKLYEFDLGAIAANTSGRISLYTQIPL